MRILFLIIVLFPSLAIAQVQLNSRTINMHNCQDGAGDSAKGCAGKKAVARWDAPRLREDGSKLSWRDITSYTLTYTKGPLVHTHNVSHPRRAHARMLAPGDWQIEITATDKFGLTSAPAVKNITVP